MVVLQNGWFIINGMITRGTPILGNPWKPQYQPLIIHTGWASEILHQLVDGKHPFSIPLYIYSVSGIPKTIAYPAFFDNRLPQQSNDSSSVSPKKTCHLMGILIFRHAPNPCLTDAEIPMFDCWTDLNMSIFMMKSYKIMVFFIVFPWFSMVFHGDTHHWFLHRLPGSHPLRKSASSVWKGLRVDRNKDGDLSHWSTVYLYTHILVHIYVYILYIYIYV